MSWLSPTAPRRVRPWLCGGMIAAVLVGLDADAGAQQLTVRFDDGRRGGTLQLERLDPATGEWYVSADELSRVLDLERFWKPETRKMVFKLGEQRVQVTVDTRLLLRGREELLLHAPVTYRHGSVMLPLEFVERVLVPAASGTLDFDRTSLVLHVGRPPNDVESVDFARQNGDTQIRIRMRDDYRYRVQTPSSQLLRVQLFGARIDPVSLSRERPAAFIRRMRAEQRDDEAMLYFELEDRIDGYEVRDEDGGRLVVVTLQAPLERTPQPEFKLPGDTGIVAEEPEQPAGCRTVILDAGHGGYDAGVRVPGMTEKETALELAKRLQPLLREALGMRVELLRRSDRALATDRRAELANKMKGDLLISLHCNGWFDPAARGFEVLFVGPQMMMQSESMMTVPAGGTVQDFLPWNSAQLPFAGRSQAFAQLLQIELGRQLEIPNRGAREADIEFLKGLAMPGVLLEVGYLTNDQEAAALAHPDFAPHLAAAIVAAVQRYCEQFGDGAERIGARTSTRRPD